MTVCLYHGNCLDGVASAWVVDHFVKGEVISIPCTYGNEPDYDLLKGHNVYIVDSSFPNDVLSKIESVSKTMTLLDHHKTAEAQIKSFQAKKDTTEIIFDMNHSGAMLTWKYFNMGVEKEAPDHIRLVEDRDLWKFNYPETEAYNAYLYAQGANLPAFKEAVKTDTRTAVKLGAMLITDSDNRASLIYERVQMVVYLHNRILYRIPVVNCPPDLASKVGNNLCKIHKVPFSITYHDTTDRRLFSLRGDGTVDVSEIAKANGGGGHHNAAGYSKVIEPLYQEDLMGTIKS